jgi:hypothetical protein
MGRIMGHKIPAGSPREHRFNKGISLGEPRPFVLFGAVHKQL